MNHITTAIGAWTGNANSVHKAVAVKREVPEVKILPADRCESALREQSIKCGRREVLKVLWDFQAVPLFLTEAKRPAGTIRDLNDQYAIIPQNATYVGEFTLRLWQVLKNVPQGYRIKEAVRKAFEGIRSL